LPPATAGETFSAAASLDRQSRKSSFTHLSEKYPRSLRYDFLQTRHKSFSLKVHQRLNIIAGRLAQAKFPDSIHVGGLFCHARSVTLKPKYN